MDFNSLQLMASNLQGQKDRREKDLSQESAKVEELRKEYNIVDKVVEVFTEAGSTARDKVSYEMGKVVDGAMVDIFGEGSGAEVLFTTTPQGYRAEIVTQKDGVSGDPMKMDGGSTCKVLAVGLRLAFISAMDVPKVMVLDEPFTGVDKENIESAVIWLRSMASKLGVQTIAISHEWPEVWDKHADEIIEIEECMQ